MDQHIIESADVLDAYTLNYVKTDASSDIVEAVLAARGDAMRLDPSDVVQAMFDACNGKVRSPGPVLVEVPEGLSADQERDLFAGLRRIKGGHLTDGDTHADWWVDSPPIWVFGGGEPRAELLSDRWKVWR